MNIEGRGAGVHAFGTDPHAESVALVDFFRFHGLWAPGVRAFRRLRFSAKASWISLAFLIPLIILAWSYFAAKEQGASNARTERDGVEFARAVLPAIKHARQLRRFTLLAATTGKESPDLADVRGKLEADFAAIRLADTRFGAAFGTHDLIGAAEADRQAASPATANVAAVLDTHGKLNAALRDLLSQVADGSGLTLDPDLDTYYLMDAAFGATPTLLEQTARMRVQAAAVARTGQGKESASTALLRADGVAELVAQQMASDLKKVIGVHPEMAAELESAAGLKSVDMLRAAAFHAIAGGVDAEASDKVDEAGAAAVNALEALQARSIDALDRLLQERIGDLQRQMTGVAVVLVICVWMAAYLFYSFYLVMNGGLNEVRRHLKLMADGDLTSLPTPWGKDDAAELMLALRGTQESMRRIVSKVRSASNSFVVASTEISGGANDLSARTEQSAANLQQSAASIEEISATAHQTASGAKRAAELATENEQVAARGGEIIGTVVDTMQRIHASSSKIGDIIGVIDGIAFQTNILALNAAVEAARAGEQGRGFAVVAGEVRSLAQRSAEAAKEIKTLISASVEKVDSGSRQVQDAGATMSEIVASVKRVNDIISEINTASTEQSQGIGQVNTAVTQLDQMTQQNAALVEQSAAAAESLKGQASVLNGLVSRFHLSEASTH